MHKEVSIMEIKSNEQAVSEQLSIEELETRLEMVAASSRCTASEAAK